MAEERWTIETYAIYNEKLREAEQKFQASEVKHLAEVVELNDRRYGEVGIEKEKALKIKEIADLSALELARESQVYKDERNDSMREQQSLSSGIYATRDDLTSAIQDIRKAIQPLVDYMSGQKGATKGSQITMGKIFASVSAMGVIIGILSVLGNFLLKSV